MQAFFLPSAVWCLSFGLPFAAYRYHYIPYHVSVHTMHRGSYVGKVCYYFAFLSCAIQQQWLAAILGFANIWNLGPCGAFWLRTNQSHSFYFSIWILLYRDGMP
jgi:hypothetical protein